MQQFESRSYRKMSGRRFDYWMQHQPEREVENGLICNLESFARLMALCMCDDSGGWLVAIDAVESKVQEILDDWPVEEVLAVGGGSLVEFNNLGLKAQEAVEKN